VAGRYRTIVADPPWHYEGFVSSVADNRASGVRDGMTARPLPYASMTLGQMVDLPIRDMASKDSFLFLWTTNRYLPDSFWLANAWGFTYRQMIVWDKGTSMSPFGGAITPNRAEFLLVCRRGSPRLQGRWATGSVVEAPKGSQAGTHSAKPDAFLDLVESVSPGPYLELFARRQRLGWDTWGDEALCHVDMEAG
jgi:N6-adenosine-specific RNA methylase IME4